MSDLFGVLLTFVLLGGNAFFVGAEFALISARRDRLEALESQGKKRARTVITAGENLSLMLAAAQLGITICSILLGKVAEPAIAHLLEVPLHAVGLPAGLLHPVAFTISLALVVVLHILLGEMVPKNIALAGPERTAMLLVPVHLLFIKLARPLISFYNLCANLTLRLLRVEPKDELDVTVSAVELSEMIGESRSEGLIDAEEHRRLTQALETTDRTVSEVMIPLDKARTIPLSEGGNPARRHRAGRRRDRVLPIPGARRRRLTRRVPAPQGRARRHPRRGGRTRHRDPAVGHPSAAVHVDRHPPARGGPGESAPRQLPSGGGGGGPVRADRRHRRPRGPRRGIRGHRPRRHPPRQRRQSGTAIELIGWTFWMRRSGSLAATGTRRGCPR